MSQNKEMLGKPDTVPKDGEMTQLMAYEKIYDYVTSKDYWVVAGMSFDAHLRDTMVELENRYFAPTTDANSKFWIIILPALGILVYIFPRKDVSKLYIEANISGYKLPDEVSLIVIGAVMGMLPLQIIQLFDGLNTVAEARGEAQVNTEGK